MTTSFMLLSSLACRFESSVYPLNLSMFAQKRGEGASWSIPQTLPDILYLNLDFRKISQGQMQHILVWDGPVKMPSSLSEWVLPGCVFNTCLALRDANAAALPVCIHLVASTQKWMGQRWACVRKLACSYFELARLVWAGKVSRLFLPRPPLVSQTTAVMCS